MSIEQDKHTIDALVDDLRPVHPVWPASVVTLVWLVLSVAYVTGAMLALGPVRPGAFDQLIAHPRFGLEMFVGCAAVILFAAAAIGQSVPGLPTRRWLQTGWLLVILWLLNFLVGIELPALEPSMLGKRLHCHWESFLYSAPPALFAIVLQQRRFPLQPVAAGFHAGIAAGLLPAVAMQITCMYDPLHILAHHAAPIVGIAVGAGLLTAAVTAVRARSLKSPR